jgi:hypothetical protein
MDKVLLQAQQKMMTTFEWSLLSDGMVLIPLELGELLLLAFPRSEPPPHLKKSRFTKL